METLKRYLVESYKVQKDRGKIKEDTQEQEFISALTDEINEMQDEIYGTDKWLCECVDSVTVLLNMAMHEYGVDHIIKMLEYNLRNNKLRKEYGL